VLSLLHAAKTGLLPFARLVADDRVHIEAHHGRLVARSPAALGGLLEVRGIGVVPMSHELAAVVGLVVDLQPDAPSRMPEPEDSIVSILGVDLPRIACGDGQDPLPMIVTALVSHVGSTRL